MVAQSAPSGNTNVGKGTSSGLGGLLMASFTYTKLPECPGTCPLM
eukprot:CAMPEP_0198210286 /NCGR_PEP_ID=MMETSP1445-20131203/20009_1 /TAXON_ID=36898 /ORGANISM="Pyramimonas sp., Strain CCMP2087" /LENGTH=44 /DNA_ID= /DNA_START= /DNA_END= /DNA_ORIENTATION=